jgi:tyrosine-specific transport protein
MANPLAKRLWGGILLLTGTAIGGGLLALPLATAETGFIHAVLLMLICWLLMTVSALLLLEVTLRFPPHANIVSIAKILLGPWGAGIAWISYLMLFYAIIAAYIASGADFIQAILAKTGYVATQPFAAILFTLLLGAIVYQGIRTVDYVNRSLMTFKLASYFLLVIVILPFISSVNLLAGEIRMIAKGSLVMVSAFCYANIIPSLRVYFQEDIKTLRQAILIGSIISLACYILWNASVMGVIPLAGEQGLIKLLQSQQAASGLTEQLSQWLQNQFLSLLAHSFTSVCVLTTFLTCSLGLADFLADGLKCSTKRTNKNNLIIYSATFLPPLSISLFYPGLLIKALNYSGVCCLILFVLLPVITAWRSRYYPCATTAASSYQLPGGKALLISLGTVGIGGILYGLYQI